MTALYIILGIIAFIILLMICPIRLKIVYDGEVRIKAGYLFINLDVLHKKGDKKENTDNGKKKDKTENRENPEKDEKKSPDKSSDKPQKKQDSPAEGGNKQEKKKNPILEFKDKHGFDGILNIVKNLLDILKDIPKKLAKHLVIKMLDVKLLVVGEDSADTAVKYGYACSVIYPVVSILENNLKIRKHNEEIVAGFLAEEPAAEIIVSASIKPWFLFGTGISAFVKFISAIAKIK